MMSDGNLFLHKEIRSTQNGKNVGNIKHIFLIFKFLQNVFDFFKAKILNYEAYKIYTGKIVQRM